MKKSIFLVSTLSMFCFSSEITHVKNACDIKKMPTACYELGQLYENGLGVKKSLPLAKSFFSKSCEYGNDQGCVDFERLDANSASKG